MEKCEKCGSRLVLLEMYCTEPYQQRRRINPNFELGNPANIHPTFIEPKDWEQDWFRDIKKKYVCSECGKEQERVVKTVKQPRVSK